MVMCLDRGANDLHVVQLMPLPPPPFLDSLQFRLVLPFSCLVLPFSCQLTQVVVEERLLTWCLLLCTGVLGV